jgi:adenylyltransferase/sulfurtransferase
VNKSSETPESTQVKEITAGELKALMDSGEGFQLIDVREPFEREESSIGGDWIPFADVFNRAGEFAHDRKVVLYCKSGVRSHIIIQRLQEKFGFANLFNLRGGIQAFNNSP